MVTDHKPLVSLLGPKTGIPTLAAARMQRWALLLSGYQYDIEYRSTHKHANADCLSRLPLNDHVRDEHDEAHEIHQLQLESLPVSVDQVRKATRSDPILSRVLEYALTGWPTEVTSEAIKPYFNKRNEITVEENCLLWGMRVVIPRPLQARVLDELHVGHPGIVRMKATVTVSFGVMLEDGEICRRRVDQMHKFNERFERSDNASANTTPSDNPVTPGSIVLPEITQASETEASNAEPQSDASAPSVATPELADIPAAQIPTMPRYPSRERKPPVRLGFDT